MTSEEAFNYSIAMENTSYNGSVFTPDERGDLLAFHSPYPREHVIISSIIVILIMLIIVLGNVLVIVAVAKDRNLRGPQNWFVASLAMSDILVGLFIMPLSLANELMGYWAFGNILCELWLATDVLLCTASILNLVLISLDRYWSITMAMTYIRRRTARLATALIAVVWGLSMVICFPPLVGWKRPQPTLVGGHAQCVLSAEPGYVVYSTVGSFYIPLCVMILVYFKIFLVTRRRARRNLIQRNTAFRKDRSMCCGGGGSGGGQQQHHASSIASREPDVNSGAKKETNRAESPVKAGEMKLSQPQGDVILQDKPMTDSLDDRCSVHEKIDLIYSATEYANQETRGVDLDKKCLLGIKSEKRDSAELNCMSDDYGERFLVRYESATSAGSSSECRRLLSVSGSSAASGTSPTANCHKTFCNNCSLTDIITRPDHVFVETDEILFSEPSDATRFLSEKGRSSNEEITNAYKPKNKRFSGDTQNPVPTAIILRTAATTARAMLNNFDSRPNSLDDPCDELVTPSPERRKIDDQSSCHENRDRKGGKKRKSKIAKQLRTAQYLASSNLAIMGQTIMRHRYAAAGRVVDDDKARALQDPQLLKRRLARAKERRAFLVLGVVMAAFVGCWLPFFSVYLVVSLIGVEVPSLVFAVIFWLGYCNSALNPFIYTIFNRDFRRAFHRIVFGNKAIGRF